MRAQSEAIGLAVIVALVIGSIVAYALFQEPTGDDTDRAGAILTDNVAYVMLESDVYLGACKERLRHVIEYAANGADEYRCQGTMVVDGSARTFEHVIEEGIANITSVTLDRWGRTYEISIRQEDGSSLVPTISTCSGFERIGTASYTFGRPEVRFDLSLCS